MIKYKGIIWQQYHGALLPKVPPHVEIVLSKEDEEYLLKISNAYFLRYTNKWDGKDGQFWYIIKDREENLEQYNSNNRRKIRKGLKNCIVKKVSSYIIANEGYEAYISAFKNYKTALIPYTKDEFYKNHINVENYDYFAVYTKDMKMIAYSSNTIDENMVNYITIKFNPNYLKLYPSYALFYEMNKYYINEKKYLYVNDGARSISHDTNIQDFLIQKFNFRKAYCKLNIIYRWDIALVVKILYPIRGIIDMFDIRLFKKMGVLLKQESIRRSYE